MRCHIGTLNARQTMMPCIALPAQKVYHGARNSCTLCSDTEELLIEESTMEGDASIDEVEWFFTLVGGKVWNDDGLRVELLGMRGGCRCCISPPCNACVDPVTMDEAERLGFHMEDFNKVVDKTEAAPVYCLREACEAWVHPDPYPHHPVLIERHGM